jgi:hypothetical protein
MAMQFSDWRTIFGIMDGALKIADDATRPAISAELKQ